MIDIANAVANNPYQGYAYSYPHKTAYRTFDPAIPLKTLWDYERKESLFLYVHIPFCEMRCGFCNLFTMANPDQDMSGAYMKALDRQANVVSDAIGQSHFTQVAIGGGTPTYLDGYALEQMFFIIENRMSASLSGIPVSCEVSPKTVTKQKLQLLYDHHVDRISIGIQSFLEEESKSLGRPQRNTEVHQALSLIKKQGFATLNIDLIYGGAGQTPETWSQTLQEAMHYQPEEVYLYPLYVRPLTGLDKITMSWDSFRLQLYRQGRDFLIAHDYDQVSMRMFRKKRHEASINSITYCCQEDGMVGLGAGARSYTRSTHYSSDYAVGRKGVKNIIRNYAEAGNEEHSLVRYGINLADEEKQRRYIIKSLLHGEGLDVNRFKRQYSLQPLDAFPQLEELIGLQMAVLSDGVLKLTADGLELSDSIGPWLYSDNINSLMTKFELR